ncbi:MAG: hypothetical protein AAF492_06500, partial [Verrucomicrobiota bacterium]
MILRWALIIVSSLALTSLEAKMTGEGEATDFKQLKDNPGAAIKLALRSTSRSVSTCAFGLYLQSKASAEDEDLIENILKMSEKDDLFYHVAMLTGASYANVKNPSSPIRSIITGLAEEGPRGQALAAAILCSLAMADGEARHIAEELKGSDLGIEQPPAKARKGKGKNKNRKTTAGLKGLPIPEVLFTQSKVRPPARATTAQMAILAAALWRDKSVAEWVAAVPLKQRGIPGAKLFYAARTGDELDPETLQIAFGLKPDKDNMMASVSPALSRYNPILPDAAMACRALEEV